MKLVVLVCCLFLGSMHADDSWKEFYKEARKELRNRDPLKRVAIVKRFAEHDNVDAAKILISIINKSSMEMVMKVAASDALSSYSSEETKKFVFTAVKKDSSPDPLLLQALINMDVEGTNDLCAYLIGRSRDTGVQTVALRAIGKQAEQKAEVVAKIISKLGEREDISVRKAAVEALGGIKSVDSVKHLIALLGDKVLTDFAIDSLQRLTGQMIGNDPTAWKKWSEGNPNFTPVNTDLKSFLTTKANRKQAADAKKKAEMTSEFYGIEIKGKNILFVLDRSGSMSAPAQSHGTRMEQLKFEFIEMMDTISYDTNLGVVLFPHAAYPAKGIEKASDRFKDRVKKFIKGIGPSGSTPISEAMTYVFEKVVPKKQIDTIYLLSDGVPNKPADQVRKLIRGLNTSSYIQIHTIALGANSQFLKDVATDNNGSYTHIP